MKKKYIFCVLCISILILEVISFLVLGKTKSRMGKIKRIPFLAYNEVTEFNSISKYNYNIATGEFEVNGETYKVEITEDGVLKIYACSIANGIKVYTEVARSKEALPKDISTDDYKSHKGLGTNSIEYTEEDLNNLYNEYKNLDKGAKFNYNDNLYKKEAINYMKYQNNTVYEGTDITEYDENLYNNYIGKTGDINFKEVIFEIANETTYLLDKKIQEEAYKGDITLDKGQYLVNCDDLTAGLRPHKKVPGASSENGYGIVVPSNVTLDLNDSIIKQINDTTLNMDDTNHNNVYRIFRIESGKNITITNGTLIGDKAEKSTTTSGERGTGIFFRGANAENEIIDSDSYITTKNITISDLVIKYIFGDGIEVGYPNSTENSSNRITDVNIENNFIYCCTRQGISPCNGNTITIKNNTIYNIIGTEPAYCIDIEPDHNNNGQSKSTDYTRNKTNSYVYDVKICNNIINNYRAISALNYIGELEITNNTIYGRTRLQNSDGKTEFIGNSIYSNNYGEALGEYNTFEVGSSWRTDNAGLEYQQDGKFGKGSLRCTLIFDNNFYIEKICLFITSFADIANNRFIDTKTIAFKQSANLYKNVYIHNNMFKNTTENGNTIELDIIENVKYNKREDEVVEYLYSKMSNQTSLNLYSNTDENNNEINSYKSGNNVVKVNSKNDSLNTFNTYVNQEVSFIRLLKTSKKQVYWIEEGENENLFDPEGMEIGVYKIEQDIDTGKLNVKKLRQIEVENGKKVIINGTEYTLSIDKTLNPSVTMVKVTLTDGTNNYSTAQKIVVKTATTIPEKENYISCNNILNVGDLVSEKCNVYSMYYVYGTLDNNTYTNKIVHNGVPEKVLNEYIKWSIIRPNGTVKTGANATKIEASDFKDGKIIIGADYCGIHLTKEIDNSSNYKLIYIPTENSQSKGFLNSSNKNRNIIRNRINSVTIYSSDDVISENAIIPTDENKKWDVSEKQDNTIIAWYEENENKTYDIYIAPNTQTTGVKIKANENSSYLFAFIGRNTVCTDKQVIYGLENLDTSEVTNMNHMFYYCGYNSMTSLDLGNNFDTSKVTDMAYMFYYCGYNAMTKLDLRDKFNTSNVENMYGMFWMCGYNAMKNLNLGNKFDTSKVTDMTNMFRYCGTRKMNSLDLGTKFNTEKVENYIYTDGNNLFRYCGTNNCEIYITKEFYESSTKCKIGSESITLTGNRTFSVSTNHILIDTSKENKATSAFLGSTTVNANITREKINSIHILLAKEPIEEGILNNKWKVGEGWDNKNSKLYDVNAYYKELETGMYDIYIRSDSLYPEEKLILSEDSSYFFANIAKNDACTDKQVIYGLENLDTSEVTNMSYMFYNCGYRTMNNLDVSVLDTSNVEDMSYMFGYSLSESGISSYIESITFGEKFDTSKVKNMEGMFYNFGRQKLQKLDVSSFDTSNVKDMKRMFFGCGYNKITELNLGENFNTSKVTNMSEMFRGTGNQQMEYLELGDKFNTNEVKNMSKMFMNCGTKKMKILELGEAFNKIAEINEDIFYNCGANGCIINVSNKIYLNEEECKLYEESIETVIADKERNVKFYTGKIIIEIKEMDESENDGVTYLSTINQNMTEEELKSKIETNGDITIEAKGPKGEIGTGSTVKITKKGEEKDYVIVIIGDLTGDGQMDDIDLLKMARYGVGLDTNLEKAHLMAGNIVKDHSFADDKDLLKIARILVGLDSL